MESKLDNPYTLIKVIYGFTAWVFGVIIVINAANIILNYSKFGINDYSICIALVIGAMYNYSKVRRNSIGFKKMTDFYKLDKEESESKYTKLLNFTELNGPHRINIDIMLAISFLFLFTKF